MPNTPLLLGYGATAMCRSENISDEDFNEIYKMFSLSGEVCLFRNDDHESGKSIGRAWAP